MTKLLKITNAHSRNNPTQEITIELIGGSPYFGHLWFNDQIFTIYIDSEKDKVSIEPSD